MASFVAEIGSDVQGTRLTAYPKETPPSYRLANATSKSYQQILALRCPTGAPPELRKAFRNGAAVVDGVRGAGRDPGGRPATFEVTEAVVYEEREGDPADNIVVLVRLHPTFEVPQGSNNPSAPRTPRRRITKVDSTSTDASDVPGDVDMVSSQATAAERKARLFQRDYRDVDNSLIAPWELTTKLVEGTLVLVYHVQVDKLRILDPGNGEPSTPPVPALPERRFPLDAV
ncbi:hypothetical protein B0H14DRAFT_3893309 [Mycena olivaceomarginata]|nr:hypothetical protein B0H14DRAFT_3893309 [Mycena olivaceomarginata]